MAFFEGIGSLELVLGLWLDKLDNIRLSSHQKMYSMKNIQGTAKCIFQLESSAFCTSSEAPRQELVMN